MSAVEAAAALGGPEAVQALSAEQVRERAATRRVFRRGVFMPDFATVQPARLALGLRGRLLERGAESSSARACARCAWTGRRPVVAETAGGRVRAGAAVLAVGAAARGVRPLRSRLTVTSSHIVLTEPVPDVLDAIGWTGGECITDARTLVHYFRTTRDGRIAFGWGGGRLACGARAERPRSRWTRRWSRRRAGTCVRMFPALEGRAVTHAWGGPIDVSPSHLPQIGTLPGAPVHYAFGFTGNGVGPTHLAGPHPRRAGARPE